MQTIFHNITQNKLLKKVIKRYTLANIKKKKYNYSQFFFKFPF